MFVDSYVYVGMEFGMEKIEALKAELKQAVLESNEYREYKRLETEISRDADLKRSVDEFRRQNFEIQYNDEIQDIEQSVSQLEARFTEIRNQGLVKNYLAAEICLCRLVQDICVSVVDVLDFDVDFLS